MKQFIILAPLSKEHSFCRQDQTAVLKLTKSPPSTELQHCVVDSSFMQLETSQNLQKHLNKKTEHRNEATSYP